SLNTGAGVRGRAPGVKGDPDLGGENAGSRAARSRASRVPGGLGIPALLENHGAAIFRLREVPMVVGSTRTPKSVPALVLVATVALQCRVDDSGNYTFGAAVEEAGEAGDAGDAATSGASGHVGVGGRGGAGGGSGGSAGSSASGGALAGGRGGASGASGGALSGEAGDAGSMDPPGSAGGSGGAGEGGDGDGEGGAGGAPEPGMGGTSTGGAPANCTMFCLPLGAECASPNECESGRCVDGVCCESTCNGECQA